MITNKKDLRTISQNIVGAAGAAVFLPIGAAVPANRKRYIYFLKLTNPAVVPQVVTLSRDGAVGASILDVIRVPGDAGPVGGIGQGMKVMGEDILAPIYILMPGETLGASIPVAPCTVFASYYEEVG